MSTDSRIRDDGNEEAVGAEVARVVAYIAVDDFFITRFSIKNSIIRSELMPV